jgi:hypothetical protein
MYFFLAQLPPNSQHPIAPQPTSFRLATTPPPSPSRRATRGLASRPLPPEPSGWRRATARRGALRCSSPGPSSAAPLLTSSPGCRPVACTAEGRAKPWRRPTPAAGQQQHCGRAGWPPADCAPPGGKQAASSTAAQATGHRPTGALRTAAGHRQAWPPGLGGSVALNQWVTITQLVNYVRKLPNWNYHSPIHMRNCQ